MCQCVVLLERVKVKLSQQARERQRFWASLVAATVKLQQFIISEPDDEVTYRRGRIALQQLRVLTSPLRRN